MALKNYASLISLPVFFMGLVFGALPELKTKQPIENIRFISKDGKYTYYQNLKGELLLEKNYKIFKLTTSKQNAQYNVIMGSTRNKILVIQDENYFDYLSLRNSKNIFIADMGSEKIRKVAQGICPKLINGDKYLSYLDPQSRTIKIFNLAINKVDIEITLFNKKENYSCPDIAMISQEEILYTDLNSEGIPGLLRYDAVKNKISTVYKADSVNVKFELCRNKKDIYLSVFPLFKFNHPSQIFPLQKMKDGRYQPQNPIFESKNQHIGNVNCSDENFLYLVTQNKEGMNEIAEFNIKTAKLKNLTSLKYVTQFVEMDGRILLPHKGSVYVLKGEDKVYSDIPMEDKK